MKVNVLCSYHLRYHHQRHNSDDFTARTGSSRCTPFMQNYTAAIKSTRLLSTMELTMEKSARYKCGIWDVCVLHTTFTYKKGKSYYYVSLSPSGG